MASFKYKALTGAGTVVSGTLDADDSDSASEALASKGYIPTSVTKAGASFDMDAINKKLARVKPQDLILFTKQFKTMFDAGIAVTQVLETLEHQTENLCIKDAIANITQDIRRGAALSDAFSKYPKIFSPLYCSMIKAGELSGTLSEVLDRLNYIIEHEYKIKKDIKSAMTYPIIVIVVLFIAFIVLLTFVVPQIVGLFLKAGVELPLPTRICMALYDFLMNFWWLIIIVAAGSVTGLVMYIKTKAGRLHFDTIILKLPILGTVFQKAAMSRFASIFALLQSSGVSVLESIRILSSVIGNAAIAAEFDWLKEKLQEGKGISAPLKNSKYFTPMIINMIAIGEETGNLDDMLREVSKHYDYEVEYAVGRMSEMIGPVMVLLLAGVVGFFAAAIMLPIFDIHKTMRK